MKKERCDMRGFLSFLILFMLSKRSMYGQEISAELERRKGCKPSPGTIYPALKQLYVQGLINEKKEGKNSRYLLTKEGQRAFEEARRQFCQAFRDVI